MMYERPLPVGLFDLVVVGGFAHAENLVVVLSLALFQLKLCVLEKPPVLRVRLIHAMCLLVIPHGLLVILDLHVRLGSTKQGLLVRVVQLQGRSAIRNRVLCPIQLGKTKIKYMHI